MPSSRGNVLFLILIAVALFAALAYAVTSSSRSGTGDVSREKADLIASQIEQYTASMAITVTRMTMAGATLDQLLFDCVDSQDRLGFGCTDPLSSWSDLDPANLPFEMFHPSGGNVSVQTPKSFSFTNTNSQVWVTGGVQISGVGTTYVNPTISSGADLVLLSIYVPQSICEAINRKAGIQGIPSGATLDFQVYAKQADNPGFDNIYIVGDAATPDFFGKPMGCMSTDHYDLGSFAFYSVITAR